MTGNPASTRTQSVTDERESAYCCRPRPEPDYAGPCTWPDTDCYENGPAVVPVHSCSDLRCSECNSKPLPGVPINATDRPCGECGGWRPPATCRCGGTGREATSDA